MSDDPVKPPGLLSKIRAFPQRVRLEPPACLPLSQPPGTKLGLYPLGERDVIMSMETLDSILTQLERGSLEDRQSLSLHLRNNFGAFFVEKK